MVKKAGYWRGEVRKRIAGALHIDLAHDPNVTDPRLYFLVRLLNLDPAQLQRLIRNDPIRVILERYLRQGDSIENLRAVKNELLTDFLPIVSPTATVEDIDRALFKLIEKIDRLRLSPRLTLEDGESQFFFYPDPMPADIQTGRASYEDLGTFRRLRGEPGEPRINQRILQLDRRHKKLNIKGGSWIVEESGYHVKNFQEDVYSRLLKTLRNGSFAFLALCQQCGQFYAAVNHNQKQCSRDCTEQKFALTSNERSKQSKKERRRRDRIRAGRRPGMF